MRLFLILLLVGLIDCVQWRNFLRYFNYYVRLVCNFLVIVNFFYFCRQVIQLLRLQSVHNSMNHLTKPKYDDDHDNVMEICNTLFTNLHFVQFQKISILPAPTEGFLYRGGLTCKF